MAKLSNNNVTCAKTVAANLFAITPIWVALDAVRAMVVPQTMNGTGIRNIELVLLLSRYSVLKTLRTAAAQIAEPTVPRHVRDLELDEFWSFVRNKKQQRWTWYGFDRMRRKVVAFVNERRTDAACQKLLKKLSGCQVNHYYTDDWQSYKKFLLAQQHRIGKARTRYIERHNWNFVRTSNGLNAARFVTQNRRQCTMW